MTESIGPEEAVDLYLNDREAEATESTSVFINPERSLLMGPILLLQVYGGRGRECNQRRLIY